MRSPMIGSLSRRRGPVAGPLPSVSGQPSASGQRALNEPYGTAVHTLHAADAPTRVRGAPRRRDRFERAEVVVRCGLAVLDHLEHVACAHDVLALLGGDAVAVVFAAF